MHQISQKERILKLRNPWGRDEWRGADKYRELQYLDILGSTEPGEFFISLEDYLTNVSFTNICKIEDKEVSYAFKNKPVPNLNFFKFCIKKEQSIDVLVNQMGDRLKFRKRKNGREFIPSWISIMVCRDEPGNYGVKYQYVKSSVSTNYQVELTVEALMPGSYILCVEALWNNCAKSPHSDFQQFCVKLLAND